MKHKEAIYIVKGKTKSALINLATCELRAIANSQLEQLADDIDLGENLSDFIIPDINAYTKEILDIRLSKNCDQQNDFSYLNDCIKDGVAYMNVRIICPDEVISIDTIKALIRWINQRIYHFGILISISELYDVELFYNTFPTYRMIHRRIIAADQAEHKPIFISTPKAISISQQNNLYHYSRDTVLVDVNEVSFKDHESLNIPKSKIENCKDCAFRLTCFDSREVQYSNGIYHYESDCQHELTC